MPRMKRPASQGNIVTKKCKVIASAIKETDLPDQLQVLLSSTLPCTVGQLKATRHPFNERFVQMVGEVLGSFKDASEKTVAEKEAIVAELTPSKTAREQAVEEAKTLLTQKSEALDKAKQAVKDITGKVKEAAAELESKKKEQKVGDKDINEIEKRKAMFEDAEKNAFLPLVEGIADPEEKKSKFKIVMKAASEFKFDTTLMEASVKVLEKAKEDRGAGFDETCLDQLKGSFSSSIEKLNAEIAEGAPAKAARAAAVEEASSAKDAIEKEQEELIAASKTAQDEKSAAAAAAKTASQHLADFMPELKQASDDLDDAKTSLQAFVEGPLASFNELKDLTEETFKVVEPEPVVEPLVEEAPAVEEARVEQSS